jgi:signal transduction histidine kinase
MTARPAFLAARSARQRLKRLITASALILTAVAAALLVTLIHRVQSDAMERAQLEVSNLSAGFEEQLHRTLDALVNIMRLVKRRTEDEGVAQDLVDWKSELPEIAEPAFHFLITAADGQLRATSLSRSPPPANYSDRDYFQTLRDNPERDFYIGRPVAGKQTKRLTIPVAMPLKDKEGRFSGVLSFALGPELLTALHRKVNLGKMGAIILAGLDGTVFGRFTTEAGLDNSQIGSTNAKVRAVAGAKNFDAALYTGPSPFDGVRRICHWRKVDGYPLVVIAALGEEEILKAATQQAGLLICLGGVALGLPLLMLFLLNREISRSGAFQAALDRKQLRLLDAFEEVKTQRERAEAANKAKSVFLATMSHELRTPLNSIIGFSEIMRDKILGDTHDRYSQYAADIHKSGEHLLHVIDDILDLSRVEAQKLVLHEEEVHLASVLWKCVELVSTQAEAAHVRLVTNFPGHQVWIFADETRLTQIIINLMTNAIKFTPAGGHVALSASEEENDAICIQVRDSGIGMSPADVKLALETFGQVTDSQRPSNGAGLGLPLAVKLTELHGGTLSIKSAPAQGTTVALRFPARARDYSASDRATWPAIKPLLQDQDSVEPAG